MIFKDKEQVEEKLFSLADESYKRFDSRLTNTRYPIIGVRKPALIAIARAVARDDHAAFLALPFTYFEHHLLRGAVCAMCRVSEQEHVRLFYDYVGYIDDWEACDLTACRYERTSESYYAAMRALTGDEREFAVRFGIVALMHNFAKRAEYAARLCADMRALTHEGYYVKMAAGWLLSVVYLADKKPVEEFLLDADADLDTRLKAISKLIDSFRVTEEDKKKLRELRKTIKR